MKTVVQKSRFHLFFSFFFFSKNINTRSDSCRAATANVYFWYFWTFSERCETQTEEVHEQAKKRFCDFEDIINNYNFERTFY